MKKIVLLTVSMMGISIPAQAGLFVTLHKNLGPVAQIIDKNASAALVSAKKAASVAAASALTSLKGAVIKSAKETISSFMASNTASKTKTSVTKTSR